jgi:hypothetical protein
MGESRGGEGRNLEQVTTRIAAAVADEYFKEGIDVDHLHVDFVTAGLYAITIKERGIPEPERFFLSDASHESPAGKATP